MTHSNHPIHKHNVGPYIFLGATMTILLSSAETGGQFSLIEGIMPPGGDGGLHMHAKEDESMHLVVGALDVTIGDRSFGLLAGDSYFAPRSVPHRLRNTGSTPARGLLITTPGGFDEFIARAGIPLEAGSEVPVELPPSPAQMELLLGLAAKFGITVIALPEPTAKAKNLDVHP